ncbi:sin3a isoform g [Anaeramoeba ignava]|uniref:Sin3a isoform g n=1 Tax=Anaeramoeba ignava TaxID=1746090 RepID=A0A9Q0LZD6_ANAIG|nr:sin3a isoform g [Anaeramoeba ignava]
MNENKEDEEKNEEKSKNVDDLQLNCHLEFSFENQKENQKETKNSSEFIFNYSEKDLNEKTILETLSQNENKNDKINLSYCLANQNNCGNFDDNFIFQSKEEQKKSLNFYFQKERSEQDFETQNQTTKALEFLEKVQNRYKEKPQIYRNFLNLIKQYKCGKMNTQHFIHEVFFLFHKHKDLILGLNNFLPKNTRITEQVLERKLSQVSLAVEFVSKIHKRFEDNPQIYNEFVQLLFGYHLNKISTDETLQKISHLFSDDPILIQEFLRFIPLGNQTNQGLFCKNDRKNKKGELLECPHFVECKRQKLEQKKNGEKKNGEKNDEKKNYN